MHVSFSNTLDIFYNHRKSFKLKTGESNLNDSKTLCQAIIVDELGVLKTEKKINAFAYIMYITAPINPSSTVGDKIRQGVVPPVGNMQDHPLSNNTDPNDKGFYENLPFHGMQNPPNKVEKYSSCALICCSLELSYHHLTT